MSTSTKTIKNVLSSNQMSLEELIGVLAATSIRFIGEYSTALDQIEQYKGHVTAMRKTMEDMRNNKLQEMSMNKLLQKNQQPRAKKHNINKFSMCMQIGMKKQDIMSEMNISESTYFRLLRAYRGRNSNNILQR